MLLVLMATLSAHAINAPNVPPRKTRAPHSIDLGRTSFKIVEINFLRELDAVNANFKQSSDRYRGIVITLEVKKQRSQPLKLYIQDFSLHYYYGESSDVAPCLGISGFSSDVAVDRPMYLSKSGRHSSETGVATSKAETVYVDLFFGSMESNTSELHLLVAQPHVPPYTTRGW